MTHALLPRPAGLDVRSGMQVTELGRRARLALHHIARRIVGFVRTGATERRARLYRYAATWLVAACAIWTPIALYLRLAPVRYNSQVLLILPGAGVSASVNLSDIGQASTAATSPYSSSSLSPTVTYKNLIESKGVIKRAADLVHQDVAAFGKPVIKLVDETSLIRFEMAGRSPEEAQGRVEALRAAFMGQLDTLRDDELRRREASSLETIHTYQSAVDTLRTQISALQASSGLLSSDQYGTIAAAAETLKSRIIEVEAALREREGAVKSLSTLLRVSPDLASVTIKLHADVEFEALAVAAAKDGADLAELLKQFGDNHPKVVDARYRYAGTRARLIARGVAVTGLKAEQLRDRVDVAPTGERAALLSHLVALATEREGLVAQLSALKSEEERSRKRVVDLVETASRLDTLNRDYKVADAVFASALARIKTSKTDIFAAYPMVQDAEAATRPDQPSSPSKPIALAAGFAGCLLLSIGLTLAWARRPMIDKLLATRVSQHGSALPHAA